MKQYRPTIDELKLRYSRMLAQRRMLRLHREARPGLANRTPIPDNSEPWLPHKPRSLAECMWISDQIANDARSWLPTSQQTS
jgi:hypothetical protein